MQKENLGDDLGARDPGSFACTYRTYRTLYEREYHLTFPDCSGANKILISLFQNSVWDQVKEDWSVKSSLKRTRHLNEQLKLSYVIVFHKPTKTLCPAQKAISSGQS